MGIQRARARATCPGGRRYEHFHAPMTLKKDPAFHANKVTTLLRVRQLQSSLTAFIPHSTWPWFPFSLGKLMIFKNGFKHYSLQHLPRDGSEIGQHVVLWLFLLALLEDMKRFFLSSRPQELSQVTMTFQTLLRMALQECSFLPLYLWCTTADSMPLCMLSFFKHSLMSEENSFISENF